MVTDVFVSDEIAAFQSLIEKVTASITGDEKIQDIISVLSNKVYEGYQDGIAAACLPTITYDVRFIGEEPETVLQAQLSKSDIEKVILLDHGFVSWIEAKSIGKLDKDFEYTLNCMLNGDLELLSDILIKHSDLLLMQSKLGHHAGLIHYLTANGVELWRQIVPRNAPEMLNMMLVLGANPYQDNHIFGGTDLLSLIETSENLAMSGKMDEMIGLLQCI